MADPVAKLDAVLDGAASRINDHNSFHHTHSREAVWSTDAQRTTEQHRVAAEALVPWLDNISRTQHQSDLQRRKIATLRANAESIAMELGALSKDMESHLARGREAAFKDAERMYGRGGSESATAEPSVPPAPDVADSGPDTDDRMDIGDMDLGLDLVVGILQDVEERFEAIHSIAMEGDPAAMLQELGELCLDVSGAINNESLSAEQRAQAGRLDTRIDALGKTIAQRVTNLEWASRLVSVIDAAELEIGMDLGVQAPDPRSMSARRTA